MAFVMGAPLLGAGTKKRVGVEVKQNRETQSIPVLFYINPCHAML